MSHPVPVAPNTLQIVMAWSGPNGVGATNVMHAEYAASGLTAGSLQLLAEGIYNNMSVSSSGLLAAVSYLYALVSVTVIDLEIGLEGTYALSPANHGDDTSAPMSPNVAYCISLKILKRYRGGHPRFYLPGIPVDAASTAGSNDVTSVYQGKAVGGMTSLLSFLTAYDTAPFSSVTPVALTYTYAVDPTTGKKYKATVTPVAINQAFADLRLDSQRRRLGKPLA